MTLISHNSIINWADEQISNDNIDEHFYIFDISLAQYPTQILVILNLEIEKYHCTPNMEKIRKAIVVFLSKKLKNKVIDSDKASVENYKIQLDFINNFEVNLGAYLYDVCYHLAQQRIVGNYEAEKKKLKDYLSDCETILNNLLDDYNIKI